MENLEYLRKQIDEIDDSLVKLFIKRMEIINKITDYKIKKGTDVLVKSREEQIIKRYTENIKDEVAKVQVKGFLEELMYISREAQKDIIKPKLIIEKTEDRELPYKVGYSGVQGSFSYQSLLEYFGEDTETSSFLTFKDVFEALQKDKIKYGVLPIENSSTGSITEIYDLLGKYNFYIEGEKCIHVEHNLIGVNGTRLCDIKEVYSKDQGFLQCSEFFGNYPDWKLVPSTNTAKSAEYVSLENLRSKACVASKKAAEVYGLEILKENINNVKNNYTRFIIIGKNMRINPQCNKINVAITLPHKAGALYSILKYFAENNSNLVKIESRPIVDKSWQYRFYIDFNGNLLEENTKKTLRNIESESLSFKLLGNYISEVKCS